MYTQTVYETLDASGDDVTTWVDMRGRGGVTVQIDVPAAAGTLSVEGSNDVQGCHLERARPTVPAAYLDITSTFTLTAGTLTPAGAGTVGLSTPFTPAFIRVRWTRTSGSGNLVVSINGSASGVVLDTVPRLCIASQSVAQANPGNTFVKITFDTATSDPGGWFVSGDGIKPTEAGTYIVMVSFRVNVLTRNVGRVALDGAYTLHGTDLTNSQSFSAMGALVVDGTQTIQVEWYSTLANSLRIVGGEPPSSLAVYGPV